MSDQLYYEEGFIEPAFFVYVADVTGDLIAETVQETVPSKITQGAAEFVAAFAPSIRISLTLRGEIELVATTTMSTDINVLRVANITLISQVILSLKGIKIASAAAPLTTVTQLNVTTQRLLQTTAAINSNFIAIVSLSKLTITDTWIVPRETRSYSIPKETRSWRIDSETRTYKVR